MADLLRVMIGALAVGLYATAGYWFGTLIGAYQTGETLFLRTASGSLILFFFIAFSVIAILVLHSIGAALWK
jgi:hypothetical protein